MVLLAGVLLVTICRSIVASAYGDQRKYQLPLMILMELLLAWYFIGVLLTLLT